MITSGKLEASYVTQLQSKQYKRKSIYNVYKKRSQPLRHKPRPLIPSKLPFFPSVTSIWEGDIMNRNPSPGQLRFWLQNCNGVKVKDDLNM